MSVRISFAVMKSERPQALLENTDSLKEEEPFDPNSQKTLTIPKPDSTATQITVQEWYKLLGTNGRGGT